MSETHTKKYIDLYDLGIVKEYMAQAPVELTWAEWQALPNSKYTDGKQYLITDFKIGGVAIDDTTTSTDSVWSSSKVSSMLPVWTGTVTALTGATTATIQNANITTNSTIEVFASVQGLSDPQMTITTGQCVLTFTALAQDTTFKLRVTN